MEKEWCRLSKQEIDTRFTTSGYKQNMIAKFRTYTFFRTNYMNPVAIIYLHMFFIHWSRRCTCMVNIQLKATKAI